MGKQSRLKVDRKGLRLAGQAPKVDRKRKPPATRILWITSEESTWVCREDATWLALILTPWEGAQDARRAAKLFATLPDSTPLLLARVSDPGTLRLARKVGGKLASLPQVDAETHAGDAEAFNEVCGGLVQLATYLWPSWAALRAGPVQTGEEAQEERRRQVGDLGGLPAVLAQAMKRETK